MRSVLFHWGSLITLGKNFAEEIQIRIDAFFPRSYPKDFPARGFGLSDLLFENVTDFYFALQPSSQKQTQQLLTRPDGQRRVSCTSELQWELVQTKETGG